jgi:hypothetical protein
MNRNTHSINVSIGGLNCNDVYSCHLGTRARIRYILHGAKYTSPDYLGFLSLERGLNFLESSDFSRSGCYYERPDLSLGSTKWSNFITNPASVNLFLPSRDYSACHSRSNHRILTPHGASKLDNNASDNSGALTSSRLQFSATHIIET